MNHNALIMPTLLWVRTLGLPGCGKTTKMLAEIIKTAGIHILCVPRIEAMAERLADLRKLKPTDGPAWCSINSETGPHVPVVEQVEQTLSEWRRSGRKHGVICITHEALMMLDPSAIDGCYLWIDETPNGVVSEVMNVPVASVTLFAQEFDLVPDELPGWSKVRAKSDKISQKYLMKDDILRDAISLFKRKASSPQGALVNASSWAEFEGSNKSMMWVSVWSPAMLTQCASVTIAAANFNDSLTGLLTLRLHPDARIETEVVVGRPRASCEVAIHYFTQGHRGSTSFWQDGDGADYLHDIHMFLKDIELGYWSGNGVVLERFRRMKGLKVRPKQEGTNALMATTSCAYIYSNKRQRSDQPLMDLFQITEDEIERARETEDIFQFVIRGGPRDPSFTGRYDIYLYDKVQAERLADYLRSNGIGTVELIAEMSVGIMDARREKIARSNQPVDDSSRTDRENARAQKARDRAQRNRDRKKAEKEQAGIEIKRGRPRKHQPKGFSHRGTTLFRNLVPSSRASTPSIPPLMAGGRRSHA